MSLAFQMAFQAKNKTVILFQYQQLTLPVQITPAHLKRPSKSFLGLEVSKFCFQRDRLFSLNGAISETSSPTVLI
ncbi:hypothetical protein [Pseudomonas sp. ef1]|uniref:hypothetical protein n=1 Tax=Pseudomonas sp. ef1 TaxID=2578139 RepID=UPI00117D0237|nr:hypothetical protein [Pseudomonas sp. ef1]TSB51066.1 hypothetical protein FEE99_16775 [Pseudomonas sp. ef1]